MSTDPRRTRRRCPRDGRRRGSRRPVTSWPSTETFTAATDVPLGGVTKMRASPPVTRSGWLESTWIDIAPVLMPGFLWVVGGEEGFADVEGLELALPSFLLSSVQAATTVRASRITTARCPIRLRVIIQPVKQSACVLRGRASDRRARRTRPTQRRSVGQAPSRPERRPDGSPGAHRGSTM